jgi:two-component sensor histidine kinase
MTDDHVIRNIPASVVSDIDQLDKAIANVSSMAYIEGHRVNWEEVLGALEDARSSLIYMAEKHDALVLKLQEHNIE